MDIKERKHQSLYDMTVLIAEITAQERHMRRFRWLHPTLYHRWLKTPIGRQYELTKDLEDGKILGMID